MKKSILFTLLLMTTVSFSVGCKPTGSNDQRISEILRKNQENLDKIKRDSLSLKFLEDGGQPGQISLNGVAVKDSDKLDSRLTISQSAGLNKSGSSTTTVKNTIELATMPAEKIVSLTAVVKNTEAEKSYINLGCELTESEIAGLTDLSDKVDLNAAIISLTASRVFICGEYKVNASSFGLRITASDIMLKNASVVMQKFTGSIDLEANTLTLIDKNKITTRGEDASGVVISAPKISLFVAGEIYGDGALTLESIGGNNSENKK